MTWMDHRLWARVALSIGLCVGAGMAWAQSGELPGRVGRLADVQGRVWIYDQEQAQWVEAWRNRPLTTGDRISTERGARAEVRIGSTELRLDGDTEVDFDRIDDDRMDFHLVNGSLALRVRSREIAREMSVRSADLRVLPERAGHYRIDREDDRIFVTAWRGAVRVDTHDQQVQVVPGRRADFDRDPRLGATAVSWSGAVNDAFSDWVARDEQSEAEAVARRYVSPEMTGVDDLDRYGRWERHPEYGMVWFPLQVAVGWAPYRHGRWTWSVAWGWTWVDDAPWGFAPFHYGRWIHWGGRWVWSPGTYVARPVYSPALVAWIGGPSVSFSITIGGHPAPAVAWVPLAPRDVYLPPFRYSPRYYERVNQPHRKYHPPQVPTGPIMYGNRGVPDAVTVVPADVLRQRQPVASAVVRDREAQRAIARERFRHEMPPPVQSAPSRVIAVPGGAEPVRVPPPGREGSRRSRDEVIDLRRERIVPAQPGAPAAPAVPSRPTRPDTPERPERPERPGRPDVVPRPQPAPPVMAPPAAREPQGQRGGPRAERESRGEREQPKADRADERGRDDKPARTPESRENMRDRKNVQ